MKKLAIILIIVLIVSGCINRTEEINDMTNDADIKTVDTKISAKVDTNDDIGTNTKFVSGDNIDNDNIDNDIIVDTESEWCKSGDRITIQTIKGQEEFIIKGTTTYQGREVCLAEQIYDNSKKIRYFSKDGKFVSEIATSSSGSGNASAYSEVFIK